MSTPHVIAARDGAFPRLLEEAERLLGRGERQAAVLVAGAAFEARLRHAINALVAAEPIPPAAERALSRLLGAAHLPTLLGVLQDLSGAPLPGELAHRMRAHSELRNRVAHEGSRPSHEEAAAAVAAVVAFAAFAGGLGA